MDNFKNEGRALEQTERWDTSVRTIDFAKIVVFLWLFTKALACMVLRRKKFIVIIEYDNKEKRTKIKFS